MLTNTFTYQGIYMWHILLQLQRKGSWIYLLNCTAREKQTKHKHPHGPKSQNPTAVYALLSLITDAIPLKLIQILQSFPQSHNDANSSSFMAPWKKLLCSLFTDLPWLPAGNCSNPTKPTPKEQQDWFKKCLKAQTHIHWNVQVSLTRLALHYRSLSLSSFHLCTTAHYIFLEMK